MMQPTYTLSIIATSDQTDDVQAVLELHCLCFTRHDILPDGKRVNGMFNSTNKTLVMLYRHLMAAGLMMGRTTQNIHIS